MLRKLPDFSNQLTCWASKEELKFAVTQLKKYDAKEGQDFIFKEQSGKYAIFLNYMAYTPVEIYQSNKIHQLKQSA